VADVVRELVIEVSVGGDADKELEKIDQNASKAGESALDLGDAMRALGGAAVIASLQSFASESIDAYVALEQQTTLLKSLSRNEYPQLEAAINSTIAASRGVSSTGELAEAANQFLSTGGNADFLTSSLSQLQQISATSGRSIQDTLQGVQDAIQTGRIAALRSNPVFDYGLCGAGGPRRA